MPEAADRESRVTAALRLLEGWAHLDVIAAAAGLDLDAAAEEIDRLIATGRCRPGPPVTLLDDARSRRCLEHLSPTQRALMHGRIAGAIRRRGAGDQEVTAHLLRAPGTGEPANVEVLRRVAREAIKDGRHQDAEIVLRRALLEPPPESDLSRILAELSAALSADTRFEDAVRVAQRARQRAMCPEDAAAGAAASYRALIALGEVDRGLSEITRAIDELEPTDPNLALMLEEELVRGAPADVRILQAAIHRFKHRSLDERLPGAASYMMTGGQILAMGGSTSAARAVAMVRRGMSLGPVPTDPITVARIVWLLIRADQLQDALGLLHRAARDSKAASADPTLRALRGLIWMRATSVAEAIEWLRSTLLSAQRLRDRPGEAAARAFLAHALLESAEPDGVTAVIGRSRTRLGPENQWTAILQVARGRYHLLSGRHEEALADLLEVERIKADLGLTNPAGFHQSEYAVQALLAVGRTQPARELAERNLARAEHWGAPETLARAQRALAACCAPREAIPKLAQAVATVADTDLTLIRAQLASDLGELLIAANRPQDAAVTLTEALDLAARIHAGRICNDVRKCLQSIGRRPRRNFAHGIESLTPAELRIARRAAAGQPNRQIAAALHLSIRTVENQLRRVYQKLGTDRRGLRDHVSAAADGDLDPDWG